MSKIKKQFPPFKRDKSFISNFEAGAFLLLEIIYLSLFAVLIIGALLNLFFSIQEVSEVRLIFFVGWVLLIFLLASYFFVKTKELGVQAAAERHIKFCSSYNNIFVAISYALVICFFWAFRFIKQDLK